MVGAEHADTRTELASTQRDHVLSDVGSDILAVLRRGVVEDPLDEIVTVLITRDINQRDAGAVATTL